MSRNPTRDLYLSIAREAQAEAPPPAPRRRDDLAGIALPWLTACAVIIIASLAYLASEAL